MKIRHINLWEAIFPHQLRLVFLRQLGGIAGTGLLAGAAALGAALASWSPSDPSFNHATALAPVNWLGFAGAAASDLAIQMFGLGAVIIPLILAAWGWRLVSGRVVSRGGARGLAAIIAVLLLAGVAAHFSPSEGWPLEVGLGGMFGNLVYGVVMAPFEFVGLGVAGVAGAVGVLAAGAIGLGWFATAIEMRADKPSSRSAGMREMPEDEVGESSTDRALSIMIGAMLHLLLVSAALVRRLLRWLYRLATGKGRQEQQSRLKIAMARAEENAVVWSGETGGDDDDFYDPNAEESVPHRSRIKRLGARSTPQQPWFGARLLRRLWGEEPADFHSSDHGPRVEPTFHDPLDGGQEAGTQAFAEYRDDEPLSAGPMGTVLAPRSRSDTPKPRRAKRRPRARKSDQPFQLPPLTLLNRPGASANAAKMSREELTANAQQLESVLDDFGIRGEIVNVRPGPVVTLYELEPAPGIKSSRVIGLADDIARSMSAISARISVVPGRNAIGIELPNQTREMVSFYDLIAAKDYVESPQKLAISLGKNIGGEPVITDLARMPHLLVAGTTGSGKSVGINAMILSLLFRLTPDQCKLIMIDPKMLELSVYDGIPHLLSPVVTDPRKAVVALKWAVREMEERYKNMSKLGVRNIDGYNTRVREAAAKGEVLSRTVQTGFERETGQPIYETEELKLEPLPYIVVVVDEMADLMMVAGKDIEGAIQRLAQMARAAGLHLIMATQRPSVDVITGTIKANFPTRISFQVTSKIDSRTILGEQGAEQLLGQGDMLYMAGGGRITRVHGAFVSDDEVESVVQFLKRQGVPEYLEAVTQELATDEPDSAEQYSAGGVSQADQLYDQAVAVVARDRKASTSYIQRRLSIGYNRAATIIERMETEGVISSANHAGKREVLLPESENEAI